MELRQGRTRGGEVREGGAGTCFEKRKSGERDKDVNDWWSMQTPTKLVARVITCTLEKMIDTHQAGTERCTAEAER
jgi:dTDP-4-dehydrorhamnose reductase